MYSDLVDDLVATGRARWRCRAPEHGNAAPRAPPVERRRRPAARCSGAPRTARLGARGIRARRNPPRRARPHPRAARAPARPRSSRAERHAGRPSRRSSRRRPSRARNALIASGARRRRRRTGIRPSSRPAYATGRRAWSASSRRGTTPSLAAMDVVPALAALPSCRRPTTRRPLGARAPPAYVDAGVPEALWSVVAGSPTWSARRSPTRSTTSASPGPPQRATHRREGRAAARRGVPRARGQERPHRARRRARRAGGGGCRARVLLVDGPAVRLDRADLRAARPRSRSPQRSRRGSRRRGSAPAGPRRRLRDARDGPAARAGPSAPRRRARQGRDGPHRRPPPVPTSARGRSSRPS